MIATVETDQELEDLTRLALAADPDEPLGDDAVPIWQVLGAPTDALLPSWYMPAPMGSATPRRWSRRRRLVVLVIVVAFLALNAAGLCSTYGHITIA